ncbi:unnamed protein product [Paramecium primaurelia]|uniref:Uncharacterized protein n=1 Tax=Paramecium primaurelia TaxID=5886 RepID=A0A8S1NCB3_PARPR|nr:unnamed protein product [Paramecium primaurelia]
MADRRRYMMLLFAQVFTKLKNLENSLKKYEFYNSKSIAASIRIIQNVYFHLQQLIWNPQF